MSNLHHSFIEAERPSALPPLATTPEIEQLLREGAPVAIGTSGGKDSGTMALMLHHHLNSIGHAGPRLLIHSDLGRIEWRESIGMVERLAAPPALSPEPHSQRGNSWVSSPHFETCHTIQ